MGVYDLITEADFEAVLAAHDIAILDFWAPWCIPCKEFAPLLEAAATQHPDMGFCRVNTKEAGELAAAFEVEHVPTLIVIRERIMLASQPGYLSEDKLADLLRQVGELDMDALREEMGQVESCEEVGK